MIEIQPILPTLSIVKPKKINKDEHPPQQQRHDQQQAPKQQEPQPMQHIDEIV